MTNKRCSFYQSDREVRLLVIHCSATRCDRAFPVEALRAAHLARGFTDIGYPQSLSLFRCPKGV